MDICLPEVHPEDDPWSDILGTVGAQFLGPDDMGKNEGSLGVPPLVKDPLPFLH